MAGEAVTFCLPAIVYETEPAEEKIRVLLEDPRRDLGVGALPAGSFTARSDETWPRVANGATVCLHGATPALTPATFNNFERRTGCPSHQDV